jgi:phage terminase small subunit
MFCTFVLYTQLGMTRKKHGNEHGVSVVESQSNEQKEPAKQKTKLNRKELQKLAKEHGINAKDKSDAIFAKLKKKGVLEE